MKLNRFLLRNTKSLALFLLVCTNAVSSAQELLGAREVIRRQSATKAKPGKQNVELNAFKAEVSKLSPQQAGERWAKLAIDSVTKPTTASDLSNYDDLNQRGIMGIMAVLPAPASWPFIASALDQKSSKVELKMLGAVLVGNQAKQSQYLKAMTTSTTATATSWNLILPLAAMKQDYELAQKAVDKLLAISLAESKQEGQGQNDQATTEIPEFTVALGKEKSTALILRILKTSKMPLRFAGELGRSIALDLCRQQGATFPIHHCELVTTVESADLYPLFNKWFPKSSGTVKLNARSVYIFANVMRGKGDPFLKEANLLENLETLSYSRTGSFASKLENPENAKGAYGFLETALKANPKLKIWGLYGAAAFAAGKVEQSIPIYRLGLAVPSAPVTPTSRRYRGGEDNQKSIIAELLVRAVAVNGTPEQVAEVVLKNIAAGNGNPETAVNLGKVLKRQDLITKGLELAKKQEGSEYTYVELLVGLGRFAEAETAIAGMSASYAGTSPQTLFRIYSKLGRYQDVIDLLDFSPDWGVTDLKDLAPRSYGSVHVDANEQNILLEAARAFLKTGKHDLGLKILVEALNKDTKDDDAYDLFVKTVTPAEAIAKFDDMFNHDQFEERPLIWKAIVLQQSGKLDEAEMVVRHAIAVDPSDGDMGKNKRMLGYKVLSQILATKGNEKDSKFFMSVVDAIRLSENADDFMVAGLVRQAISMYSDSLKIFADAYCIQSRIAVNLANEGKTAEAIEHFKHAFELMPSSFGRVETHCFGCEGVFTTGPAEGIAETVLQDAAKKNPKKPQSQYLLGYLRREQGRDMEAAQYFRKAVELDPDYLNAWKELLTAAGTGAVTMGENEQIVLNLLRLDPQEKHGALSIGSVQLKDFTKIYDALANVYSSVPPGGALYELSGSKKSNDAQSGRSRGWYMDEMMGQQTPGSKIAQMEPIRSIIGSAQSDGANGRIVY